jgi:hypothetical protein
MTIVNLVSGNLSVVYQASFIKFPLSPYKGCHSILILFYRHTAFVLKRHIEDNERRE